MKNLLIILAILLTGCDNQVIIHPELLTIDYNVWSSYKNHLKTVKEFSRVPSTNRDSLIEPIGLSLRSVLNFNEEGLVINSRCIDCSIRSHGEPINLDFVTKYHYEDGRLIKFQELSFDTTTYHIRYENFKSLTTGFKDKERGYISIEQYDSVGRPVERIEFNFFYAYRTDQVYQVLLPIQTSKKQAHLRISLTGQVIDLFSNDGKNYEGVLTNIITEYSSKKVKGQEYEQSVANQKIFQKIDLDNAKVKYVFDSLIASKQLDFPTDSLIPEWNINLLHCGSIHFQYKINRKFKTQEYFCPWSQNDSVTYKAILTGNYDLIKKTFNLDSLYNQFENELPKGKSYSRDGHRMMYKMTDKESENWVKGKPRRDYLKSIKDKVDNYIDSRLNNQEFELVEIDCFENYRLVFGTNGILKNIEVFEYDKPNLRNSLGLRDFLEDKRKIRKCKKKIKQIFSVT